MEGKWSPSNICDPLMDCRNCKSRFRADNLIEILINQLINHGLMKNAGLYKRTQY